MPGENMKKYLIAFALLACWILNSGAAPIDVKKIGEAFSLGKCNDPKMDVLELGRKLLSTQTVSKKTVNTWLKEELSTGKDRPELNWIRAVNPWILPEDFTARTAFTECASHLRTYSDAKAHSGDPEAKVLAAQSLERWKNCVSLVYLSELPPEFTQLQTCLK